MLTEKNIRTTILIPSVYKIAHAHTVCTRPFFLLLSKGLGTRLDNHLTADHNKWYL